MSATGKIEEAGFTLIEMLVVLAIMGLIGGIAFPAIERAIAFQQFRLAAATVEGDLHAARASAIARGTIAVFRPGELPGDVALSLPRGGLAFYPDGSASGGEVRVTSGAREWRFAIDGTTGEIARAS